MKEKIGLMAVGLANKVLIYITRGTVLAEVLRGFHNETQRLDFHRIARRKLGI